MKVELSDAERANGWTPEALAAYLNQRDSAAAERIDPTSPKRRVKPVRANSRYSVFRWRRR